MRSNMKDKFKLFKNGLKIGAAVAAMALAVCVGNMSVAYADDVSGVDGGIKWTISGDTLTIEPAGDAATDEYDSGKMRDYTIFPTENKGGVKTPWGQDTNYNNVKKIIIKDGVSNIGAKAFGNASSNPVSFDSVTISSDVTDIGKYAFVHSSIGELTIYGLSVNIDDTAFIKTSDDSNYDYKVDVSKVSCYAGNVFDYFNKFTSENGVSINNGGEKKVKKSIDNINTFNIKITSINLLAKDSTVWIKWDGLSTSQEAEIVSKDIVPQSVLTAFMDKGYESKKLKLFDLSKTVEDSVINKAEIKIPTPSDWAEHYDTIKVFGYETASDGTVSISEITDGTKVEKDYITFTAAHFSPYALYYSYDGSSTSSTKYDISIDASFFEGYYQWGVDNGSSTFDVPTKSSDKIAKAFSEFLLVNSQNNSGYKVDTSHLLAFDLSATIDGNSTSNKIEGLKVRIPVPTAWKSTLTSVQVLTITDANIVTVNPITTYIIDDKAYVEFTPPHFSSYALYNSSVAIDSNDSNNNNNNSNSGNNSNNNNSNNNNNNSNSGNNSNNNSNSNGNSSNGSNNNSNYGGSGRYDDTPKTGVKDFMWIAIPAALMLMGFGVIMLGLRKQKSIDE